MWAVLYYLLAARSIGLGLRKSSPSTSPSTSSFSTPDSIVSTTLSPTSTSTLALTTSTAPPLSSTFLPTPAPSPGHFQAKQLPVPSLTPLEWQHQFCADGIVAPTISHESNLKALSEALKRVEDNKMIDDFPTVPSCTVDSDCEQYGFCIDGACRPCRDEHDCAAVAPGQSPRSSQDFPWICNAETRYSCSECRSNVDCPVYEGSQCVTLGYDAEIDETLVPMSNVCLHGCQYQIPHNAVLLNQLTCEFKCRLHHALDDAHKNCYLCPNCDVGTYFGTSGSNYWTACTTAVAPLCRKCEDLNIPVTDPDFCATLLPPSDIPIDVVVTEVTDDFPDGHQVLNAQAMLTEDYPCSRFECKVGWFLDAEVNQCRRCNLMACPDGYYLKECGGSLPGNCDVCDSGYLPEHAFWKKPSQGTAIHYSEDVCDFQCADDFRASFDSTTHTWNCVACDHTICPVGYFLEDCGPDESVGHCTRCPEPPSHHYYMDIGGCHAVKCDESVCGDHEHLIGCAFDRPGVCQSCPEDIPPFGTEWLVSVDHMGKLKCDLVCQENAYLLTLESTPQCIECTAVEHCPPGHYLAGCGGKDPGTCEKCAHNGIDNGSHFFSGTGTALNDPNSCLQEPCNPVCPHERRTGVPQARLQCGLWSEGECRPCEEKSMDDTVLTNGKVDSCYKPPRCPSGYIFTARGVAHEGASSNHGSSSGQPEEPVASFLADIPRVISPSIAATTMNPGSNGSEPAAAAHQSLSYLASTLAEIPLSPVPQRYLSMLHSTSLDLAAKTQPPAASPPAASPAAASPPAASPAAASPVAGGSSKYTKPDIGMLPEYYGLCLSHDYWELFIEPALTVFRGEESELFDSKKKEIDTSIKVGPAPDKVSPGQASEDDIREEVDQQVSFLHMRNLSASSRWNADTPCGNGETPPFCMAHEYFFCDQQSKTGACVHCGPRALECSLKGQILDNCGSQGPGECRPCTEADSMTCIKPYPCPPGIFWVSGFCLSADILYGYDPFSEEIRDAFTAKKPLE